MPKLRNAKLDSASSRLALKARDKPFYLVKAVKGCWLGYRRVKHGAGSWYCRVVRDGSEWTKKLATADDFEKAAPPEVLDYWQALDLVRKLARREPGDPVDENKPTTVSDALEQYRQHLKVSGGDEYNSGRLRVHLSDAMLSKPVSLLGSNELARWRDGLVTKGLAPATANRLRNSLRACLTLAAKRDKRIRNAAVWEDEFDALPNATRARNVVLDPATIGRVIAAAYAADDKLGLLINVLAETGTRPSQAVRLEVGDLDGRALRLLMPRSAKGHAHKRSLKRLERVPVPISAALAHRLAEEARGRAPHEPLLRRASGEPWEGGNFHRTPFATIVTSVGLDPEKTTPYALRHSFIARSLLAGMPVSLVAELADTSEAVIRRHYGAYLSHHAEDRIARLGLLPTEDGNVVPLAARRPS